VSDAARVKKTLAILGGRLEKKAGRLCTRKAKVFLSFFIVDKPFNSVAAMKLFVFLSQELD